MLKFEIPRRFAPTLHLYAPTECSTAFGMVEFHMGAVRVHPEIPFRAVLPFGRMLFGRMLFRPREGDWDFSVRVKAAEEKKLEAVIQYYSHHACLLMHAHACTDELKITMVILHALILLLQYYTVLCRRVVDCGKDHNRRKEDGCLHYAF